MKYNKTQIEKIGSDAMEDIKKRYASFNADYFWSEVLKRLE